ncbi:MAG: regulatory protein RecX [Trueperaceae bacterium]|nr:regulatory protein RecX [Trueperaceae bacterium]MCC6311532.1 regulatory protein RecX [Trueperaceae bacterium]MCO5175072.1 recombination regulator RecX [Trueperaceae bacterium]MCW5819326.1 regulatory protein RecX [Trueperaceae bacterium]
MNAGEAERRSNRKPPKPLTRDTAWDYLLYLLSRRMYTTAELTRKLVRRGLDPELATALVGRLVELELVNDATYADLYVSTRSATKGRLGLRQELRQKGVAPEIAEARLEELTPEDQLAAATALLRKNAWRYRPGAADPTADRMAVMKARAKAFAFLARRGFSVDASQGAVAAVGWFEDDL